MVLRYGNPEEVGMSREGIERAEAVAQRLVETGNTPSVVELVARDGVIVSHKAFGTNGTLAGAEPLLRDALFPVCSVTKSITAVAIMILVEEGLVGINRPVCEYLKEFKGGGKEKVNVFHLLTHTSGINDEFLPKEKDQEISLWRKPGEVMSYSSFGYGLLGDIISKVSGMSYADFIRTRVFTPLGMKDSYLAVPEAVRSRIVKRNAPALWPEWLTSERQMASESPAGGMYTTALDLAIFCAMLQAGGEYNGVRILSPVSVTEMTRNQIPGVASEYRGEFFPEAWWGLGLGINGNKRDGGDLFSPQAWSHWGACGIFFCVDPVYRTIQIYFSVEVDLNYPFKGIYADAFNNSVLSAIKS